MCLCHKREGGHLGLGGGSARGHPYNLKNDVGMVAVAKATVPRVRVGWVQLVCVWVSAYVGVGVHVFQHVCFVKRKWLGTV